MKAPRLLIDPVEEAGGPHWLSRTNTAKAQAPRVVVRAGQSDDHVLVHSDDPIHEATHQAERDGSNQHFQYSLDLPNDSPGKI